MRIPRIYLPATLHGHSIITLDAKAAGHVVRVLRLRTGAALRIFNGQGDEYAAHVESIARDAVCVQLGEMLPRDVESPLRIHLAQGISRAERMDYVMQKAVELGVVEITPLETSRCVVRLDATRAAKRTEHWQGVIVSACEQSGRARLPVLHPNAPLGAWLARRSGEQRLVLHPDAPHVLRSLPAPTGSIGLVIGPEGGLSDDELEQAIAAGCKPVRLGPRILRTETAALAALCALQTLWGDLGG